jgi:diamine N-acetyltransferase
MYGFNFEHPRYQAFIIRLMVDDKHQKRGYGRFEMEKMLEAFGADERIKEVGISYEPHNEVARKLYASLGFTETGEIVDEEMLALLRIRP